TSAGRDAGEFRLCAGDSIHAIEQYFRGEPAGDGVRVIDLVVFVPFVRDDGELVRPRLTDHLQNVPGVKAVLEKLFREIIEQFWVGRGITSGDVADGVNDANAKEIAPEAVDVAFGEILVVLGSNPRRHLFPPCRGWSASILRFVRELRR